MILVLYCLLFLGPALFAIGYLNAFAFARLFGIRESRWTDEHSHRFLLLIPAHNEQDTIHETLRSISAISYDAAKLNTVVIADNCTDKTVDIVRASGFQCLERSDRNHVGKGFAISWALQQIDLSDFDVVAMVDADIYPIRVGKTLISVTFCLEKNVSLQSIFIDSLKVKKIGGF